MGPALAVAMLVWYLNHVALATRRHAVVHAGCVAREGIGVVLPAKMEAGKSTLVAALFAAGWDYLSDEYGALCLADGRLHPHPVPIALDPGSFPLFPDLRPHVSAPFDDPVRWHLPARRVRPGSCSGPVPPGAVVFPRYERGAAFTLRPVTRREAACALAANCLNRADVGAPAVRALAALARGVPAYALAYDRLADAVGALDDVLGAR